MRVRRNDNRTRIRKKRGETTKTEEETCWESSNLKRETAHKKESNMACTQKVEE